MPSPAIVDTETPYGLPLSARFKKSFAHFSMTVRNPDILRRTIETLRQEPPPGADVEAMCKEVEALLDEIRTDVPWPQLTSTGTDAGRWNRFLRAGGCACARHWLTAPWVVSEAYLYRRLRQAAEKAAPEEPPDPFLTLKRSTLEAAMPAILELGKWLSESECGREQLVQAMRSATRANIADMSLSGGQPLAEDQLTAAAIQDDSAFLVDQSDTVWQVMQSVTGCVTVDIICDNIGFELFADLCLAQVLSGLGATKIRFHLKSYPYYVSDATQSDLKILLDTMGAGDSPDVLKELSGTWNRLLQDGQWTVSAEDFWTMPITYDRMAKEDPQLYAMLQESALAIFKGDVNFRKLVGDLRWPSDARLEQAVRGFRPCPLAALRTLKSDVVVGLPQGLHQQLDASAPGWMTDGQRAIIVCVPDFQ